VQVIPTLLLRGISILNYYYGSLGGWDVDQKGWKRGRQPAETHEYCEDGKEEADQSSDPGIGRESSGHTLWLADGQGMGGGLGVGGRDCAVEVWKGVVGWEDWVEALVNGDAWVDKDGRRRDGGSEGGHEEAQRGLNPPLHAGSAWMMSQNMLAVFSGVASFFKGVVGRGAARRCGRGVRECVVV